MLMYNTTVRDYLENRKSTTYNKKIRILDNVSKKYLGEWIEFSEAIIKSIKITTKIIFIFI